ncbi:MAG: exodeoxyribonuclease VII large subunit [Cyanobacteria bacterium P01_A01_bin.17]
MTSGSPNLLVPPTVISVGGLTTYIQTLLEEDRELIQVWITGEVSSANPHRSGVFFTLQDPDVAATLHCVAWKSYRDKLVIQPEAGEQVIVLGRIRLYPKRGEYQLMVWQVLPAGEGLRSLRYRQLRARLSSEGLFDLERKLPLPKYPQTIAVVTSPQAAAWGDIKRTLKFRHPGMRVLLSPANVQGELAPDAIATAIHRVEQDGRADVLVLSRGGGASEDMACFNDERVVRAISDCSIPVISGIGHQRDESLADLAADAYAHTPTAAAELAVPRLSDLQANHEEHIVQLYVTITRKLDQVQDQLQTQKKRLHRLGLDRQIERDKATVQQLKQQLGRAVQRRLLAYQKHHQLLQQKLVALDPTAVLQRGYAVVRTSDRTIVRQSDEIEVGQTLNVQFSSGLATVQVTALESSTGSSDV